MNEVGEKSSLVFDFRQATFSRSMTKYVAIALTLALTACGPSFEGNAGDETVTGGEAGSEPTGGNTQTGASGSTTGGSSGTATGGYGNSITGGSATGGSNPAGASTGGNETGGNETGGSETGGTGGCTFHENCTSNTICVEGSCLAVPCTTDADCTSYVETACDMSLGLCALADTIVNPEECTEATLFTNRCDGVDQIRCQYTPSGGLDWQVVTSCPTVTGCSAGFCNECVPGTRNCYGDTARICAQDETGKHVWTTDEVCSLGCVGEGVCNECQLDKWECPTQYADGSWAIDEAVSLCELDTDGVNRWSIVYATNYCKFGCNENEGCALDAPDPWMVSAAGSIKKLTRTGKTFRGFKVPSGTDPQVVCENPALGLHHWTNGSTGTWVDSPVSANWTEGSGWSVTSGMATGTNTNAAITTLWVVPGWMPERINYRVTVAAGSTGQLKMDCGNGNATFQTPTSFIEGWASATGTPGFECSGDRRFRVTGFGFTGDITSIEVSGGYPTVLTGNVGAACLGAYERTIVPYDIETCPNEYVMTPGTPTTVGNETRIPLNLHHAGTFDVPRTLAGGPNPVSAVYDATSGEYLRLDSTEPFTDPMWVICSNQAD